MKTLFISLVSLFFVGVRVTTAQYCLAEHNRIRSQYGLPPFTADRRLEAAAKFHNDVMIRQNCFSHQCDGEPTIGERISRQGYRWISVAENIVPNQRDCIAAVRHWMTSPGHRRNILSNSYRHVGCHMATSSNRTYFTCKFAQPW